MQILEAGCGSGSMAREIAKAAPRSVVVGVDLRDKCIDYARRRAEAEGLENLTFETGDAVRGLEPGRPFLRFCVGYPVSAALSIGDAVSCLARSGLISVIRSLLRPEGCGECRQTTDHT